MSFDWSEYLSLAEDLGGAGISGPPVGAEALQRSCVSRAYYAAFILARNHLRDVDQIAVPRSGAAHVFVARTYKQHPDPRRALIGSELERLRSDRNICDYDDVVAHLPNLMSVSIGRARLIIGELARL